MTENPTKFTVFQKNQADAFLFSHFSAVDLASTEHCCNSHHLLLLLVHKLHWRASKCWNSDWSHHLTGKGRARSKQTTTNNIFVHFVNFIVYPIILDIW